MSRSLIWDLRRSSCFAQHIKCQSAMQFRVAGLSYHVFVWQTLWSHLVNMHVHTIVCHYLAWSELSGTRASWIILPRQAGRGPKSLIPANSTAHSTQCTQVPTPPLPQHSIHKLGILFFVPATTASQLYLYAISTQIPVLFPLWHIFIKDPWPWQVSGIFVN